MPVNAVIRNHASIEARKIFDSDTFDPYIEREILPQTQISADASPQMRVPLGLMGRFSMLNTSLVSCFVENSSVAERASVADLEDCARAGQYFINTAPRPLDLEAEDIEGMLLQTSLVQNSRLNLLAGIQVYYDFGREDLVPTLVYHKGLKGLVFNIREGIAGALLASGRDIEDLKGPAEDILQQGVMNPNAEVMDFVAEAAARSIAGSIQAELL